MSDHAEDGSYPQKYTWFILEPHLNRIKASLTVSPCLQLPRADSSHDRRPGSNTRGVSWRHLLSTALFLRSSPQIFTEASPLDLGTTEDQSASTGMAFWTNVPLPFSSLGTRAVVQLPGMPIHVSSHPHVWIFLIISLLKSFEGMWTLQLAKADIDTGVTGGL